MAWNIIITVCLEGRGGNSSIMEYRGTLWNSIEYHVINHCLSWDVDRISGNIAEQHGVYYGIYYTRNRRLSRKVAKDTRMSWNIDHYRGVAWNIM